jgi:urease accessory protein UreH
VELGKDANFLGWQITKLGGTARGEKFLQGEMQSHIEINHYGFIDKSYQLTNKYFIVLMVEEETQLLVL